MLNIIIQAALMSFKRLLSFPIRQIFLRIFIISILCLFIIWFLLKHLFAFYLSPILIPLLGHMSLTLGWIGFLALVSFVFGISHLFYILLCPLINFIGSFFADNIITIIEKKDFAAYAIGRDMDMTQSILFGLRFFFLALFGNLLALMLYFIPPLHIISFYLINGYIFGRIYFMLNALRFENYTNSHELFHNNWDLIVSAGIVIAIISAIPLFGIITPVFAPIFMAYIYKNIKGIKLIS